MVKINNVILSPTDFVLIDGGEIQVAKKRVSENSTIYGANGNYVVHDGGFENQERTLKFSVLNFEKVMELSNLFKDVENTIEFDYLKSSKYYADLVEITFQKQGIERWLVDVKLRFNPFRYSIDEDITVIGSSGSINNIGNVFSEPEIEIEGNGEVSLTIGSQIMRLRLDTKAYIDCRHMKQNIYDKNRNLKNSIRLSGVFFELKPGLNGIVTQGNVTRIKVKGNWRWRV